MDGPNEQDPGWQFLRMSREEMVAMTAKPFDSKKNVWVPDAEDGFIAAEIKSAKGDQVTVMTAKGMEVSYFSSNLSFLSDRHACLRNVSCTKPLLACPGRTKQQRHSR